MKGFAILLLAVSFAAVALCAPAFAQDKAPDYVAAVDSADYAPAPILEAYLDARPVAPDYLTTAAMDHGDCSSGSCSVKAGRGGGERFGRLRAAGRGAGRFLGRLLPPYRR